MPHFCHEEVLAILAAIPVLRLLKPYLQTWWHRKAPCPHEKEESEPHGNTHRADL